MSSKTPPEHPSAQADADVDLDIVTDEASREMDELDSEARAHGYDSASDPLFRLSLYPELNRMRRAPRDNVTSKSLHAEDEDEGYLSGEDDISG